MEPERSCHPEQQLTRRATEGRPPRLTGELTDRRNQEGSLERLIWRRRYPVQSVNRFCGNCVPALSTIRMLTLALLLPFAVTICLTGIPAGRRAERRGAATPTRPKTSERSCGGEP